MVVGGSGWQRSAVSGQHVAAGCVGIGIDVGIVMVMVSASECLL